MSDTLSDSICLTLNRYILGVHCIKNDDSNRVKYKE